ncbi:MAG: HEPN domain-containing protein [Trichloromonadaceae bacterium]
MIDIDKQIRQWRTGAEEDWEVARSLVAQQRIRHGLFFAHLALEKTLKAHVCRATQGLSPPIHNLLRLADHACLTLETQQRELLAEVNSFNIEGRYPELLLPQPTSEEAKNYLTRIEEFLTCLHRMF